MSMVADGPIIQIGCVVDDLDKAEQTYSASFGITRWSRFTGVAFAPERTTYRGAPADLEIDVSLGYSGTQQVELIQPVRGRSIYTEFLERSGPGVHHLAWAVDNMADALDRARATGLVVVQQGEMNGMEFAYLETPGMGTHFVELMRLSPQMREGFAAMQAAAAVPETLA
ncbi:VOC family protein [Nocardioides sp. JQ2195]|uniref:VOC family protein n=1 Tax=Nocardioides sp. JQ2195 TaxID=2592334 RepID=UPI00143E60C8|nr:VOC family protein [Nocardioides sp. JQ2195]QIX26527.1 VOC family protein [Nocardioides sp. JQ2195]